MLHLHLFLLPLLLLNTCLQQHILQPAEATAFHQSEGEKSKGEFPEKSLKSGEIQMHPPLLVPTSLQVDLNNKECSLLISTFLVTMVTNIAIHENIQKC